MMNATIAADAPPAPRPEPSPLAVYVQAARAFSFPASIVPVLIGSALAYRGYGLEGANAGVHFAFAPFALTMLGAILAHAGGNVFNDYFDFVRGVDTRPEHGSGILTQGLLSPQKTLRFALLLSFAAALCGAGVVLLSPTVGAVVLPLALLGIACAVLYPLFLKKWALGDITIMASFGLGLLVGAYAVQVPLSGGIKQIGLLALLSLPVALLVDAILHANNMRDAADDAGAGVTTIASLLGPKSSLLFQGLLLFGPVALVAAFALLHLLPYTSLATLLTVPFLIKAYKTGSVPFVAQSHLLFGVLYAASVALPWQP